MLLVIPAVLWVLFFLFLPVVRIFALSFWDGGFTLHNYKTVFADPVFYKTLWATLKISVITTFFCLVLGFPVAHLIATSGKRLSAFLTVIVIMTFWMSLLVRTYAWMVILGNRGLLNQALMQMGIIQSPIAFMYNLTGVIIGMVHILLPFMIFSLVATMKRVDQQLLLAAFGLGASAWQRFFYVYLPLTSRGIIAGSLIVFMIAFGYFITPALLGGRSEMMLGQLIEFYISETMNWGRASALSVVLILIVLSLAAIYTQVLSPSQRRA